MKILYIVAYAALFLLNACGDKGEQKAETSSEVQETTIDETVASGGITDEETSATTEDAIPAEHDTQNKLPEVNVPEFEGADIQLFEAEDSLIYSINKNILFTTGSAGLRPGAEQNLRRISTSIAQRSKDGQIKIYVYIDPADNPNYNRDVAGRRVQAIKEWLQTQANIDASRIVVQPIVEVSPDITGSDGISKEHKIEIVVRNTRS